MDVGSTEITLRDYIVTWLRKVVYGLEFRFDTIRTAMISYNSNAYMHYLLNAYSTQSEVLDAVSTFTIRGGYSNAKSAIDMCRDLVFTSRNGDRRDVENVVVLLTDGCSTVDHLLTQPAAQTLKDAGARFYAVAIGDIVDMAEMTALATNNATPYLLRIEQEPDIQRTVDMFLDSICRN